ncbi:MAG: FAD-dependent oxidoreductase, partial [Cyanobacteria bacterium P01_D01_bin.36]
MSQRIETDVLVVGSGAAGMVTALRARERGLRTLLLESTDRLGGNSAISGGGVWVPNNHVLKREGQTDSYEEGQSYLDACVGDVGAASSPERRHAYLTEGPAMVRWLEDLGLPWVYARGYADYYPERQGGKVMGRCIEAKKYNIKRLGRWADKLRFTLRTMPIYTYEFKDLMLSMRTWKGFWTAARIVGLQATLPR